MEMSQGRRQVNKWDYKTERTYIDGNTVRRERVLPETVQPVRKVINNPKRNGNKVRYMNPGYVLFLIGAILCTAMLLISYVKLQSELTITKKQVASMESELNALRTSNDEMLKRVNSSVNMDEIKRIAVEELGMTYASEGQVIVITDEGSDYVRQLKSID